MSIYNLGDDITIYKIKGNKLWYEKQQSFFVNKL